VHLVVWGYFLTLTKKKKMKKDIYNKIAKLSNEKVELKSEKVELKNSSQEFQDELKAADKEAIKALSHIDNINKEISKALSASKKAEDKYNNTLKKYEDVKSLFKQIGVPVTSTLKAKGEEANSNRQDVRKFISDLEKINIKGT
jgi:chromosome segregation ATPase